MPLFPSAAGILFGPVFAALVAGLGDFMGQLLVGAYFPGYTVTAFLTGLVYGLFLHRRVVTVWRVACAVGIIAVVLNLFVNTIWIQMTTGKAYLALLPTRIVKSVIMAPFQIVVIRLLAGRLQGLEKYLFPRTAG
ncbi:MAG: folate family ECF transporter S component [Hydrogeniiclostridium mannosilyticum]